MPIGAAIGALSGGILGVKLGRKWTFVIADLLGAAGCVIWIFEGPPLFIGRFISGIAVGINSAIVPLYINDISPSAISGTTGLLLR